MEKHRLNTEQEKLEQKIAELQELLDTPITSKEDRMALEARLEPVLVKASNEAIVALYNHKGGYPEKEFEKRVNDGVAFDPDDLWDLAWPLGVLTLRSKKEKSLYDFFAKAFANSVPQVDRGQMADFIARNIDSQVDLNTTLLKQAVSYREDITDVVEEARIIASNSDEIFISDSVFASLYWRAQWFRNDRENMNSI